MTSGLSRRSFIKVSAGGALLLSAACAPSAPNAPRPTAGAGSANGTSKTPYPSYVPVNTGFKPEYHVDDPRFDDGFDNYPANPIKAVTDKPGSGGTINILNPAY